MSFNEVSRDLVFYTTTERKCKYASGVNGQHEMNPTRRYTHMFEEEEKEILIETTTEILSKKK